MLCPVCDNTKMKEIEKEDVLIDICPNCKGVWLDRGELEKITIGLREDHNYYESSYKEVPRTNHSYKNEYDQKHDKHYPSYEKYDKEKYDKYQKYDKYGRPYKHKRKKSMIDIFSDLL